MNAASEKDQRLLGKIMLTIAKIAAEQGIAETGYRVVNNCGEQGARQSCICTSI